MITWASEEPADSFQAQIQRFLLIDAENDVSFLNASSGRRRVRENIEEPILSSDPRPACKRRPLVSAAHGSEKSLPGSRIIS